MIWLSRHDEKIACKKCLSDDPNSKFAHGYPKAAHTWDHGCQKFYDHVHGTNYHGAKPPWSTRAQRCDFCKNKAKVDLDQAKLARARLDRRIQAAKQMRQLHWSPAGQLVVRGGDAGVGARPAGQQHPPAGPRGGARSGKAAAVQAFAKAASSSSSFNNLLQRQQRSPAPLQQESASPAHMNPNAQHGRGQNSSKAPNAFKSLFGPQSHASGPFANTGNIKDAKSSPLMVPRRAPGRAGWESSLAPARQQQDVLDGASAPVDLQQVRDDEPQGGATSSRLASVELQRRQLLQKQQRQADQAGLLLQPASSSSSSSKLPETRTNLQQTINQKSSSSSSSAFLLGRVNKSNKNQLPSGNMGGPALKLGNQAGISNIDPIEDFGAISEDPIESFGNSSEDSFLADPHMRNDPNAIFVDAKTDKIAAAIKKGEKEGINMMISAKAAAGTTTSAKEQDGKSNNKKRPASGAGGRQEKVEWNKDEVDQKSGDGGPREQDEKRVPSSNGEDQDDDEDVEESSGIKRPKLEESLIGEHGQQLLCDSSAAPSEVGNYVADVIEKSEGKQERQRGVDMTFSTNLLMKMNNKMKTVSEDVVELQLDQEQQQLQQDEQELLHEEPKSPPGPGAGKEPERQGIMQPVRDKDNNFQKEQQQRERAAFAALLDDQKRDIVDQDIMVEGTPRSGRKSSAPAASSRKVTEELEDEDEDALDQHLYPASTPDHNSSSAKEGQLLDGADEAEKNVDRVAAPDDIHDGGEDGEGATPGSCVEFGEEGVQEEDQGKLPVAGVVNEEENEIEPPVLPHSPAQVEDHASSSQIFHSALEISASEEGREDNENGNSRASVAANHDVQPLQQLRDDMQNSGVQHQEFLPDIPEHPATVRDQAPVDSPAARPPLSSGEREVNVSQAVDGSEKDAELGPRIVLCSSPSRNPPPPGQPSPGRIEQQVAEQDGRRDGRENVLQLDEQASSRGGEQEGQEVEGSNNGINKPVDNSSVSPQQGAMRDDFASSAPPSGPRRRTSGKPRRSSDNDFCPAAQNVDSEERVLAPAEHEENEVQQHDSCAASSPSGTRGAGENKNNPPAQKVAPGHKDNPAADDDDDDAVVQAGRLFNHNLAVDAHVGEGQKSQQLQKHERVEESEAPNQDEVVMRYKNLNPSEDEAPSPVVAAQVGENQMQIADSGEQLESAHSSPLSERVQRRAVDELMEDARRGEFRDSSSSSPAAGSEINQQLRGQMGEAAAVEPPAGLLDEVVQHNTGGISSRGATSEQREVLQEPAEDVEMKDVEMKDNSEANYEEPGVLEQDGGALSPAAHEVLVPAPAVLVDEEQPSTAAALVLAGEAVANERSTSTKAGVAVVSAEEVQEEILLDEDARLMGIANGEEADIACSQPSARMSCEDEPKVATPLHVPDQNGLEEDDCSEEELVQQVGRNFLSGNIKVQRHDYTERTAAAASCSTSHKRPAAVVSTSGIISPKLERLRDVVVVEELQEQPAALGTNKADFAIAMDAVVINDHVENKASPPVMVSGGMEFLEARRDRKLQYLSQPAKFSTTSGVPHSSAPVGVANKKHIRRATSTLAPMPVAQPKDGLLSSSSASSSPSSSNSSASSSPWEEQEASSHLSAGSSSSSSGGASRSRTSCNYKSDPRVSTVRRRRLNRASLLQQGMHKHQYKYRYVDDPEYGDDEIEITESYEFCGLLEDPSLYDIAEETYSDEEDEEEVGVDCGLDHVVQQGDFESKMMTNIASIPAPGAGSSCSAKGVDADGESLRGGGPEGVQEGKAPDDVQEQLQAGCSSIIAKNDEEKHNKLALRHAALPSDREVDLRVDAKKLQEVSGERRPQEARAQSTSRRTLRRQQRREERERQRVKREINRDRIERHKETRRRRDVYELAVLAERERAKQSFFDDYERERARVIGSLDPVWRTQLLTTPGSVFWNDLLVPKCGFADKYRVVEGCQGVAFGRELVDIRDVKALPPRMLLRIECNFWKADEREKKGWKRSGCWQPEQNFCDNGAAASSHLPREQGRAGATQSNIKEDPALLQEELHEQQFVRGWHNDEVVQRTTDGRLWRIRKTIPARDGCAKPTTELLAQRMVEIEDAIALERPQAEVRAQNAQHDRSPKLSQVENYISVTRRGQKNLHPDQEQNKNYEDEVVMQEPSHGRTSNMNAAQLENKLGEVEMNVVVQADDEQGGPAPSSPLSSSRINYSFAARASSPYPHQMAADRFMQDTPFPGAAPHMSQNVEELGQEVDVDCYNYMEVDVGAGAAQVLRNSSSAAAAGAALGCSTPVLAERQQEVMSPKIDGHRSNEDDERVVPQLFHNDEEQLLKNNSQDHQHEGSWGGASSVRQNPGSQGFNMSGILDGGSGAGGPPFSCTFPSSSSSCPGSAPSQMSQNAANALGTNSALHAAPGSSERNLPHEEDLGRRKNGNEDHGEQAFYLPSPFDLGRPPSVEDENNAEVDEKLQPGANVEQSRAIVQQENNVNGKKNASCGQESSESCGNIKLLPSSSSSPSSSFVSAKESRDSEEVLDMEEQEQNHDCIAHASPATGGDRPPPANQEALSSNNSLLKPNPPTVSSSVLSGAAAGGEREQQQRERPPPGSSVSRSCSSSGRKNKGRQDDGVDLQEKQTFRDEGSSSRKRNLGNKRSGVSCYSPREGAVPDLLAGEGQEVLLPGKISSAKPENSNGFLSTKKVDIGREQPNRDSEDPNPSEEEIEKQAKVPKLEKGSAEKKAKNKASNKAKAKPDAAPKTKAMKAEAVTGAAAASSSSVPEAKKKENEKKSSKAASQLPSSGGKKNNKSAAAAKSKATPPPVKKTANREKNENAAKSSAAGPKQKAKKSKEAPTTLTSSSSSSLDEVLKGGSTSVQQAPGPSKKAELLGSDPPAPDSCSPAMKKSKKQGKQGPTSKGGKNVLNNAASSSSAVGSSSSFRQNQNAAAPEQATTTSKASSSGAGRTSGMKNAAAASHLRAVPDAQRQLLSRGKKQFGDKVLANSNPLGSLGVSDPQEAAGDLCPVAELPDGFTQEHNTQSEDLYLTNQAQGSKQPASFQAQPPLHNPGGEGAGQSAIAPSNLFDPELLVPLPLRNTSHCGICGYNRATILENAGRLRCGKHRVCNNCAKHNFRDRATWLQEHQCRFCEA
ncbi:unnamed protein product [Amoebophrya sp. A120]|nr:unnamed protein product [Amoebophrya sp. A120]|eukprot:GSA120T00020869001.1